MLIYYTLLHIIYAYIWKYNWKLFISYIEQIILKLTHNSQPTNKQTQSLAFPGSLNTKKHERLELEMNL